MRRSLPGPARVSEDDAAVLESRYGVAARPGAVEKINRHLALLAKWNRAVPLVGRLSALEILERGFFESFWAAASLPRDGRVADAGSGAGFPGLAMKLHRPDLRMTLIESNLKKVLFLREAAAVMGLEAAIVHGAAEDFEWESVDIAVSRGLRPSPALVAAWRAAGVAVLLLHGEKGAPGPAGFRVVESRPQPASRLRRATLYAPPGRFT